MNIRWKCFIKAASLTSHYEGVPATAVINERDCFVHFSSIAKAVAEKPLRIEQLHVIFTFLIAL